MERGRPKLIVDRERLETLRSQGFTWDQISSLMAKTLQRRAHEWNISYYTPTSDQNLDVAVDHIISQFPNSGEIMVNGHTTGTHLIYLYFVITLIADSCPKTSFKRLNCKN